MAKERRKRVKKRKRETYIDIQKERKKGVRKKEK